MIIFSPPLSLTLSLLSFLLTLFLSFLRFVTSCFMLIISLSFFSIHQLSSTFSFLLLLVIVRRGHTGETSEAPVRIGFC